MKVCPTCSQMMRFEERFALISGFATSDPAWVCQNPNCRLVERVRMQ